VDASRRDFLRKVIAGSAFAVPLIASFSMEGLTPETAEALASNMTLAPNLTLGPCCQLALGIEARIKELADDTEEVLVGCRAGRRVRKRLLAPLGSAALFVGLGVVKGLPDCNGPRSLALYGEALDDVGDFIARLERFGDSRPSCDVSGLLSRARSIGAALKGLIEEQCAPDATADFDRPVG
jgi:hypothetical protein